MAYDVVIGPSALADLEAITTYLTDELGSMQAARSLRERVDEIVETLASFPGAFPPVDDGYLRHRGYRKAMAGNYVVVFRVTELDATVGDDAPIGADEAPREGVVAIMRVFHGSQKWQDLV